MLIILLLSQNLKKVIFFHHLTMASYTEEFWEGLSTMCSSRESGYKKTIVAGKVAFQEGVPTEELGGKLIRGSQATNHDRV